MVLELRWQASPYSASYQEFGIWDFALTSGYKGEIWDLQAKLGLFGTISGLWFLLGESPKFGTSLRALQCRAYLFGGGVKDGP